MLNGPGEKEVKPGNEDSEPLAAGTGSASRQRKASFLEEMERKRHLRRRRKKVFIKVSLGVFACLALLSAVQFTPWGYWWFENSQQWQERCAPGAVIQNPAYDSPEPDLVPEWRRVVIVRWEYRYYASVPGLAVRKIYYQTSEKYEPGSSDWHGMLTVRPWEIERLRPVSNGRGRERPRNGNVDRGSAGTAPE